MTEARPETGADRKTNRYDFDRHTPSYRHEMADIAAEMQVRCPIVWSETYGGGFDTTTALTAHALEWPGEHPSQRARLSRERGTLPDSATEEFLRFYTPAPGDARTITADCQIAGQEFNEGDRVWLSWTMANRDPSVFSNPNEIDLARTGNRHMGFGLGLHRRIGSNVARVVFKRMLLGVLDRLPGYACDPAGTVHYDTIGVINGMKNLPATFTPGHRTGPGLCETLAVLQKRVDDEGIAGPAGRTGPIGRVGPTGPPSSVTRGKELS